MQKVMIFFQKSLGALFHRIKMHYRHDMSSIRMEITDAEITKVISLSKVLNDELHNLYPIDGYIIIGRN